MTKPTCPSEDVLSSFLLGRLSDKDSSRIEGHFADCVHCLEIADSLVSEDTLTNALSDTETQVLRAASTQDTCGDGIASAQSPSNQSTTEELDLAFLSPAESNDEIGRLNDYRILEVIGVGGMGIVFRAEDAVLHRSVALKVMKPGISRDESARERFLREARGMAAVEHDNVVPILQVGEAKSIPYLAMPLLRGESLATRLRAVGTLPTDEVLRITRDVCAGLVAAHAIGLVHRDIKPDNIWLEEGTGRVKILDFGLAQAIDSHQQLTQSGLIVGTPGYLSPEQASGLTVDARSDLFSIGILMYCMLTGASPFARPTLLATLGAIGSYKPEPPYILNQQVPRPVSDLVMRLIEKDPESRFATAAELIKEFEAVSLQLQPETLSRFESPPGKKNRLSVLKAGMAVSILLAGVILIIRDRDGNVLGKFYGAEGVTVETINEGDDQLKSPVRSDERVRNAMTIAPTDETAATRLGPLAMVQAPPALTANDGETVNRHTLETVPIMGGVAAAVSPDGKFVATFSDDGVIRIWNSKDRTLEKILVGHFGGPPRVVRNSSYIVNDCMAWHPGGGLLGVADATGHFILWDVELGIQCGAYHDNSSKVDSVQWSPDGTMVALRLDRHRIHVLDRTAKLLGEFTRAPGGQIQMSWSPESERLAIEEYGHEKVYLWNVLERTERQIRLPTANYRLGQISWAPDGNKIALVCATGSNSNGFFVECDLAKTEVQQRIELGGYAGDVTWSADGESLIGILTTLTDGEYNSFLVSIRDGTEVNRVDLELNYRPDGFKVRTLPDGDNILVEQHDNSYLVVNAQTGNVKNLTLNHYAFLSTSSDASVCAWSNSIGVPSVRVRFLSEEQESTWDIPSAGIVTRQFACTDRFISLAAEKRFAVFDREAELAPQRYNLSSWGSVAMSISPDNTSMFTGNQKGDCSILSLNTSDLVSAIKLPLTGSKLHQPFGACHSPDSKEIVIVGRGGVAILDASDGSFSRGWYEESWFHEVAWSPDGRWLAVVNNVNSDQNNFANYHIKILDAKTGVERATRSAFPDTGGPGLHSLTWSTDGKYLAVTGCFGLAGVETDPRWYNQLVVWNADTWKKELTRPINAKAIQFSDERTLVYSTHEGRVVYEDVSEGVMLRDVPTGAVGQFEAFTPNGKELLKVNGDRIAIWDLKGGRLKTTLITDLTYNSGTEWAAISGDGHFTGSKNAHEFLRHVIRTEEGVRLLAPFEFRNEFGWINDPE